MPVDAPLVALASELGGFDQQLAPSLPSREPVPQETALVPAGQVIFAPTTRVMDYVVASGERRLEVRDFVRSFPVVQVDLAPAGETGLLQPSDWKAKWIGYDVKTPEQIAEEASTNDETLTFEGLSWMWTDRQQDGRSHFTKKITLPAGTATRGHGVITADSEFELVINGQRIATGNDWRKPQSVQYMRYLRPGQENTIEIFARHSGDTPAGALGRCFGAIGSPLMLATQSALRTPRRPAPLT